MTQPAPHRPYLQWLLVPPIPDGQFYWVDEASSVAFISETLTTYAEIAAIGRKRFPGSLNQQNGLFQDFRNYLRQALSNFDAAQSVSNRSAGLLYYYAALNFAKAELLDSHSAVIVNKRIGHGLSFNPTNAKTVLGDKLIVKSGVFPLLYERRVGKSLPLNTVLPIRRLLSQVPEIGSQVRAATGIASQVFGFTQLLAIDATHSWLLLACFSDDDSPLGSNRNVTRSLFESVFQQVDTPPNWRDHFAFSRRIPWTPTFWESRSKVKNISQTGFDKTATSLLMEPVQPIIGVPASESFDAWVAPSLYRSKLLPMPPALARYALTYYASSLVRYKPQMFDAKAFPEQAYLFDAIARELALPMLQDALDGIRGGVTIFHSDGSLRS